MRYRLAAQIGLALMPNLALLGLLALLFFLQQSRTGLESFLCAPARERVRELARLQQSSGLTLAVYEDIGLLVAGPGLGPSAQGKREIRRRRDRRDRPGPPIFVVRETEPNRYWIGYHFPLVLEPGSPPVRHTLTVISPWLLTVPFFFDWRPCLAGLSLAFLVTALCWVPFLRCLTRSIHAVQLASAEIAEGRFDVQLPVRGTGELADLAGSVRPMAEQFSQLVHGRQRFLADVAHELCTPLSRIQLSVGILGQTTDPSNANAVARHGTDVARMSALVGDLLSFTKGAVRKPVLVSLDLTELVARVIAQENAAGADVAMQVDAGARVFADDEYLSRALANPVRNAIRYAAAAGPTRVTASGNRLTVSDCGPGLPEADQGKIFSPFYRSDAERTPGIGGAGLRLAILKCCIEACGGKVSCRNRHPAGLDVVIEIESAPSSIRAFVGTR